MRIFQSFLAFLLLLSTFSVLSVFGQCTYDKDKSAKDFITECSQGLPTVPPGTGDIKDVIIKVAEGAISFGSLFAIGAIVWAGIQYTKAYGEDEKLKKAKNTAIYAVIGLLLLLTSFGLVDMFINFLFTISGN